jgi:hypothetical protein
MCAICAAIVALVACSPPSRADYVARSVTVMPVPWPSAALAAPDAPPRILKLWMNETSIVPGSQWFGRVATTTNTASLEIRTESFSFNATRVGFGQFVFAQHVLDIVPQYKRGYTLSVIARNTAGARFVAQVPIELR